MEGPQSDEIRFIDLLAIAIRRRLWIFLGTGLGLIVSVGMWLLPRIEHRPVAPAGLTLTASVTPAILPFDIHWPVGYELDNQVNWELMNYDHIKKAYLDTLASDALKRAPEEEQETTITQFAKSAIKVSIEPSKVVTVTMSCSVQDREVSVRFLKDLVQLSMAALKSRLGMAFQQSIDAVSTALASQPRDHVADAGALLARAHLLKELVADPQFPAPSEPSIAVAINSKVSSRGGLSFISIFVGLVAGLVVAFVIEGLDQARRNPENRELLRRAWKREP